MDVLLDIIHTFDYDILLQISSAWRGGASDSFWAFITALGDKGILWIVLAIVLLCFRKTRRAGVAVSCALLLGLLVGNVWLKEMIQRPRPFVTHDDLIALVDPGDRWSFPSGHALSSFAAATALCYHWRWAGIAAYVPAAMIAFSRLYACVHYPTDVLGGAVIGALCGFVAAWVTDRLIDRCHTIRLRKGA